MERYRAGFDGVHATSAFKRGMEEMMLSGARMPNRTGMTRQRKLLLIALLSAILLLTACAAYAIYWSSTQRAKAGVEAQLSLPEDERQIEAERYADEVVKAMDFTAPLSGRAAVGDATIALESVTVFDDADGGEYVFNLNVSSDTIGFVTSFDQSYLADDMAARERLSNYENFCEFGMDARDFVLTIDGERFSPYCKPDDAGAPEPASDWSEPDAERSWTSGLLFRKIPYSVTKDSKMNLSGTLYSCTASGERTGTIGSFSIDFDYRYPTELVKETHDKVAAEFLENRRNSDASRLDVLENLPEAASPVNLAKDNYCLLDVTVLPDGFLFGERIENEYLESSGENSMPGLIYLDGYLQPKEIMDMTFTRDTAQPEGPEGCPVKSIDAISKVPYYRDANDMPETVLVFAKRDLSYFDYEDEKVHERDADPLDLVFRVNRKTGEVKLPKDETERADWIAEHEALFSDGRSDARDYALGLRQTVGGMTVCLDRMWYRPESGQIEIKTFFPNIRCELMTWETKPVIKIDRVELQEPRMDAYYAATSGSPEKKPYVVNIDEWVETYDLTKMRFYGDEQFRVPPVRMTELPETFLFEMRWDLYDLNEEGERTFIGTFEFRKELRRDGYTAFDPADENYERSWAKAYMAETTWKE